jgi:hypothetical protein
MNLHEIVHKQLLHPLIEPFPPFHPFQIRQFGFILFQREKELFLEYCFW